MMLRQGLTVCLVALCLFGSGCSDSTDKEEYDVHKMAQSVDPWDIWLVEVDFSGDEVRIGDAKNITNRPGYDNQPQFLPDGTAILYTSIRDAYQSDIWLYDIASGTHAQITNTNELEFSPTPMPSGDGFSTVRVEEDAAQRLWHFSMDGSTSQVILPDVDNVGYYNWIDGNRVAMFIIGEEENFSLHIGWVNYDEAHLLVDRVGNSFGRSPVSDDVVFTRWPEAWHDFESEEDFKAVMEKGDWQLELISIPIDGGDEQPLTKGRMASNYFTWTPQGDLLMAEGSSLYRYRMNSGDWQLAADFSDRLDGNKIQRLAVNPDGNLLAMTVAESKTNDE